MYIKTAFEFKSAKLVSVTSYLSESYTEIGKKGRTRSARRDVVTSRRYHEIFLNRYCILYVKGKEDNEKILQKYQKHFLKICVLLKKLSIHIRFTHSYKIKENIFKLKKKLSINPSYNYL